MDIGSRKVTIFFLVVLFLHLFSLFETESVAEDREKKDLLQQMIELVVEANPKLISQNRILLESKKLPEPWPWGVDNVEVSLTGGYGTQLIRSGNENIVEFFPNAGFNIAFPIFSPSKWQKSGREEFEIEVLKEEAQQKFLDLKESVISELLEKVSEISKLENERDGLQKLEVFLENQSDEIKMQIKTGIAETSELRDLGEKIIETNIQIRNTSNQLRALRRETAVNLGGERWKELLTLLEKIGLELPGG